MHPKFRLVVIADIFLRTLVASAQDPTPVPAEQVGATAEVERIIVTGSHIPTAEEVGPNPVLTIDREMIDKSGERTAEELIRNLTVAGPQGVRTSNKQSGSTFGASSIALRGFDPSDTLTLLDGRRVASYPLGAGINEAQTFVDLSSIPGAAIGSIEILTDGASVTYGADAVTGVVNIKLRHNYHGAEATVNYGNTLDKDSGEFSASILFGVGDDRTQLTGGLTFYHRNSIYNRDRGYSAKTHSLSTNSSPLNLQLSSEAVIAAGGNPPAELGETFFGRAPFFTDGDASASDYIYASRRAAFYNFNAFSQSLPDSERYGGFFKAEHKIFGDRMVLYGDSFYQNVKSHYELAPVATGNFITPGFTTLAIPPRVPGATLGGPSYEETGVPVGAYNPFNPFQQIISGASRGRLSEFGNRVFRPETDAFLSTIGLKGDKLFDGSWGYDAGFRYSEVKNTSTGTELSGSRFNRILNAADPIFDPASPQFIGTTVPYNPFGDFRVPIASNALPVAFATLHLKDVDISKLATLDFNIYTTSLFKLPAGGVGLAFGGQFRRENLEQNPDELEVSGDALGTSDVTFTHSGRKTYAFYAEGDIPVFSPTFNEPGLHALEFTAAVRFEEFLSNSTNVLVPKFGLRWQPFDESLTIRATWGEGFHEPSLIELFGNPTQFITDVFDPVTDTFVPDVPVTVRSNRNLQPEDSRSFNGGIVFTPKFVPGLTLTVDLFDVESKGRVIQPTIDDLLAAERTGHLLPGEKVNRDADGNILLIENAFQNGGSQKARGIDFALQYQIETRFGTFTSVTQATFLDSLEFALTPDVPEKEKRSREGNLKWKANSRFDWTSRGLDLVATVHYLDGYHEKLKSQREHYIKQTWFFDVQGSYSFKFVAPVEAQPGAGHAKDVTETEKTKDDGGLPIWKRILNGTTVTLGCNNVFGHDPPDANTTTNYEESAYDSTGRFVYLSLTKKF